MTESMLMPVVPTSDRTIASRALLDEVSYADGLLATGERGIGYLLEDRAPGSTSRPTTTRPTGGSSRSAASSAPPDDLPAIGRNTPSNRMTSL